MASTQTLSTTLLRRPLPPVKKKEDPVFSRRKAKDKKDRSRKKDVALEVYNSSERQTTRHQETGDLQEAKMREYRKRIELMLFSDQPKGAYPFPFREPRKQLKIDFNAFIDDSYERQPPAFTLDDFLQKQKEVVVSDENQIVAVPEYKNNVLVIRTSFIEKHMSPLYVYTDKKRKKDTETHPECKTVMLDQNGKMRNSGFREWDSRANAGSQKSAKNLGTCGVHSLP